MSEQTNISAICDNGLQEESMTAQKKRRKRKHRSGHGEICKFEERKHDNCIQGEPIDDDEIANCVKKRKKKKDRMSYGNIKIFEYKGNEDFIKREHISHKDPIKYVEKKKKKKKDKMHHGHTTTSQDKSDGDFLMKEPFSDDAGAKYVKKRKKEHKRTKHGAPEYHDDSGRKYSCETAECMTEIKNKMDDMKSHHDIYNKGTTMNRFDIIGETSMNNTNLAADNHDEKDSFNYSIHGKKKRKKKKKSSKLHGADFISVDNPLEELTWNDRKAMLHNTEIGHAHLHVENSIIRERKLQKKEKEKRKKEKRLSQAFTTEVLAQGGSKFLQTDRKKDNEKKRRHWKSDPGIELERNDTEPVATKKKRLNCTDVELSGMHDPNYNNHIAEERKDRKKNKKVKKSHFSEPIEAENESIIKDSSTFDIFGASCKAQNNFNSVFSPCEKERKTYSGKNQSHREKGEVLEDLSRDITKVCNSPGHIKHSITESEAIASEHEVSNCRMPPVNVSKYHLKWHISAKDKEECKKLGIEFEKGRWRAEEMQKLNENFQSILIQTGMTNDDLVKLIDDKSSEARKRRTDLSVYHILLEGINRPIQLVHQKLKKLCDPNHFKGKWLKSEEKRLLELYNIHGNNWIKIGEMMGRSGDSVLHKIQRLLCGPVNKNAVRVENTSRWTEDEVDRLSIAVEEIRNNWKGNSSNTKEIDSKQIPWSKVANAVKTRSSESCRHKWVFDLSLREPGIGKKNWTTEQNILFLEKLRNYGKKHENDIDWAQILKDLKLPGTVPVAKRKWKTYRLMIPCYKKLDFEQQLDWLMHNFVKRMREKGHYTDTASCKQRSS